MKFNKKDFKYTFTRGSGPGGQHKNKVESCVVVTHISSGMREKCEETRSKLKNQNLATERLIAKLEEVEHNKKHEKQNNIRKELIDDKKAFRTYNFPRNEVVDKRTGKRANLKSVLDGDLDQLK